jgi:hypothetical protein
MEKKDFWKIFEESDKEEITKIFKKTALDTSRIKDINKWFVSNKPKIFESYVTAVLDSVAEAWSINFNIYCSFLYIICNKEKIIKELNRVEPMPQSTNLQKELDTIYTKRNIEKAIEELGVFTEPKE